MRAAIIENGTVANIILVDSLDGQIDGANANIGDTWDGATFATPAPVVTVPPAVTMRQARLVLLGAGKLSLVNSAIASMSGAQGDAARIEWDYSNEVRRDSALIGSMKPLLGLTDAGVDSLFVMAAGL
jgi:hypothetical protein